MIDVVVSYHSTRQINKKELGLLFEKIRLTVSLALVFGWGPKVFPNWLLDTECLMTGLSLRNM